MTESPELGALLCRSRRARILLLQDVYFTQDESWSVWQGFGSWSNVIRWTPFDWPPLYYLTLDFWVEVVGLQPLALRLLSVFSFLIGAACFYLILKRHGGAAAAFMGLLIYGGMSYTYIGIAVRGYSLMLLLILLAWLIAQRCYGGRVGGMLCVFGVRSGVYLLYRSNSDGVALSLYFVDGRQSPWGGQILDICFLVYAFARDTVGHFYISHSFRSYGSQFADNRFVTIS